MKNLQRRVEELEGGTKHCRPLCWVLADDGEAQADAIARHQAVEGCIDNSGGHVVWLPKAMP